MKTMFCVCSVIASLGLARAQDLGYAPEPADYEVPPVVYTAPVIYHMPVVYNAPVAYYAPVYYVMSAAAAAYSACSACSGYENYCPTPSTVVHITSHGTYSYSTCNDYYPYESTVFHVGGGRFTPYSAYGPRLRNLNDFRSYSRFNCYR